MLFFSLGILLPIIALKNVVLVVVWYRCFLVLFCELFYAVILRSRFVCLFRYLAFCSLAILFIISDCRTAIMLIGVIAPRSVLLQFQLFIIIIVAIIIFFVC